ncbi:MAG: hypothetical protein M1840_007176 [Geoglossum simile]|nr:MAG: hypothetical protein M1840_007176 [Geoglossum simile]
MSPTSVATLPSLPTVTASASTCPNCGHKVSQPHQDIPVDAQRRIEELEAQVKILTTKATAAVDKLADYEDELQRLKTQQMGFLSSPPTSSKSESAPRADEPGLGTRAQNRLSSFLTTRKSSPQLAKDAAAVAEQSLSTQELQRRLSLERQRREKAEGQLTQASGELEELSASLFQQANEMVATERKERAKLEERVAVLEKRDGEKRIRLERLEKAVQRVERVRGMLAPP